MQNVINAILMLMASVSCLYAQTALDSIPLHQFGYGVLGSMAISPDGSTVATGSGDGYIRLWDIKTGTVFRTFKNRYHKEIGDLHYSSDGKKLLSCVTSWDYDSSVCLWDLDSGTLLWVFSAKQRINRGFALSPDGSKVVAGTEDRKAYLWDAQTGELIKVLDTEQDGGITSVGFSQDGSEVLTVLREYRLKKWNSASGDSIGSIGFIFSDSQSYLSPDGKIAFLGAYLQNTATGDTISLLKELPNPIASVAFSRDGTRILTGLHDGTARLWDVTNGSLLMTFSGHIGSVSSVAFTGDGSVLTGSRDDSFIRLWEIATGNLLKVFSGHTASVTSASFSPDGKKAFVVYVNEASIWDMEKGTVERTFLNAGGIFGFSPDGSKLLTYNIDTVSLWDTHTMKSLKTFVIPNMCLGFAFSRDCTSFLVGSQSSTGLNERTVMLFDVTTGTLLKTFTGLSGSMISVDISSDGSKVLANVPGNTTHIWDTSTADLLFTYNVNKNKNGFSSAVFMPNTSQVLIGTFDKGLLIADYISRSSVWSTNIWHKAAIGAVAVSTDGVMILSGSDDKTAALWDTSSFVPLRIFKGFNERVTSVAFSVDGTRALTGSYDGTLRLWETFRKTESHHSFFAPKDVSLQPQLCGNNSSVLHFLLPGNLPSQPEGACLRILTFTGQLAAQIPVQADRSSHKLSIKIPRMLKSGTYLYSFSNTTFSGNGMVIIVR